MRGLTARALGFSCRRVERSLRGQQVWTEDHGNLRSTCVRLLQKSASGAKEAGVEFTNVEKPQVRLRPRAKRTQHSRNKSLRPRLFAGVQGSWAGASHSRVIPHTTTA